MSARRPLRRVTAALGAAAATVVLAGCSIFPGPTESPTDDGGPLPTTSADGYVELPLYFVALNGQFPPNTTGREVACQDLLVRTTSVPVRTEDPVASAIGFLLTDEQYSHGDPPVTNSLDPSEDALAYGSHRIEGDTVVLELTGDLVSRSHCESFRIRAQLNRTAAAAAGVENAEVYVNGVLIEDLLGLSPMELGEEITTPGQDPEPTEGTTDDGSSGGGTTDGTTGDATDGTDTTTAP
ncbi:MAG: hypothetical protein QJR09_05750 [Micrococcus sp.]|nr:hypothetical protein [Micrococcus sp.]